MDIYEKIFQTEELLSQPPILVDIGASEKVYGPWSPIAKHCICLAFDADAREIKYIEDGSSGYKKIYIYNKIVSAENETEMDFFLTKSPFCSSLLEPNLESLKNWDFAELFQIENKIKLPTTNLVKVISELNIKKIDWFKTDSQGTDLRLFKSLDKEIISKILVADFEPGIIDSYKNEDKLSALMSFMDTLPFWVQELKLPKVPRISQSIKKTILLNSIGEKYKNHLNEILKSSPFCGEISYFNSFQEGSVFDKRDHLLMWIFADLREQYGFALEIAARGQDKFGDKVFTEIKDETLKKIKNKIRRAYWRNIVFKFKKIIP